MLCFDGDSAGQKATERSIPILLEAGLNVKVVRLPNGNDPDECIKLLGAEKVQSMVDNAMPYVEFLLEIKKEKYNLKNNDDKGKYIKEALAIISKLKTASEQEIYIKYVSNITDVSVSTLKRDLQISDDSVVMAPDVDVLSLKEYGNIKAVKYILLALKQQKP